MSNLSLAENDGALEKENDQKCLESPKYTCALGGALAVLVNIERVIPIVHAGSGCGGNQLLSFRTGGGNQGIGYVNGMNTPSTNLTEREVVFGGEDRLRKQIRATIDLIDGDAYVVANGCTAGMIGDDVKAVVREFAEEKTPVLYVNSSGFAGNTYLGYEATLESLIEQLTEKQPLIKGRVNIFGFVPYQDIFWRGNLEKIADLLREIGLEPNQVMGDFSGIEGIKRLSSAELTIVVSSWVGLKPARLLEEKYGIPYISFPNLPVGPRDSSEFLTAVGKALKLSRRKIEKVIAGKEQKAYQELDIAGDVCAQFATALPFAIVAGSATAVGITRFLANEAGFTPTLVIINDDPLPEVRTVIRDRLKNLGAGLNPPVVFEVDSYHIRNHLKSVYFRVLLASSQERFRAQEQGQIQVSVTYPAYERLVVNDTYAGYGGGITLLEDFMSKFIMPF
ncbi:MAG TPA: nitrogenase component 1 [Syntrophomonas sp.]|nr:nitrogenase component 1 [Syntrophomonas sp.]